MGCVWVQISSQGMIMGEGRRRGYNDFSLRMSSSLSKRWMCIVENLSRVFLSEWPLLHLWVMRVYITWVKGKQVTLTKPPDRKFRDYLVGRPYPQDTRENDSLSWLFSFQTCASHMALSRVSFSQNLLSIHARFFTNLILNPIQQNPKKYKEQK